MPKIHSNDRCPHCGHWADDDEHPFVIYSKARAKWLEEAVKQNMQVDGDDAWIDWIKEGKRLSSIKE